jgi:RNA polymerase sigma factor (TIGR02999 family)
MLSFMSEVTRILSAIEQGDPSAAEQLLPLVYEELRKLAAQRLAQEAPGQTLQATALVHEAYLRLVDAERAQHWNSKGHFFAAAAEAMRRILSITPAASRARSGAATAPTWTSTSSPPPPPSASTTCWTSTPRWRGWRRPTRRRPSW